MAGVGGPVEQVDADAVSLAAAFKAAILTAGDRGAVAGGTSTSTTSETRYRGADMALRRRPQDLSRRRSRFNKIQGTTDFWILRAASGRQHPQTHDSYCLKLKTVTRSRVERPRTDLLEIAVRCRLAPFPSVKNASPSASQER